MVWQQYTIKQKEVIKDDKSIISYIDKDSK